MNTNFFEDDEKQPEWRQTHEELKSCKGFENIADEKAEIIIDSLVNLARTLYQLYRTIN